MVLDFPFSMVGAPLLAFFLSYFSIFWLIKRKANWVLDQPNARSLHTVPVPRIGGAGLLLGAMTAWLCFSASLPSTVLLGLALLMVISLIDDIWHAPVWSRLLIHAIAAAWFAISLLLGAYDWLTVLCVIIATIWMSNLYNFMDGSDGLAGGMTIIGFGYYGLIAFLAGDHNFAMINFSVAAAAMAFLLHNFHPARVFMGDAGSVPLGFLAAVFGILGWLSQLWTIWVPLLIFSPFIADATVTLTKRLLQGKKIWQAHREHYYQRLVQSGFGHRNTALAAYALMLTAGISAIWINEQDMAVQQWVMLMWGGIYLAAMMFADRSLKPFSDRG
ncbi:MAG: glycosyl transferase [Proteobacteria bacterium SG_bin4]|nr:MAG: glycosyl transferase [Proteobacteria bacterium SG_bin4]